MATLTTIDPSDIGLSGGAARVLIIHGKYQPSIDRENALANRRKLVICVAGETEIVSTHSTMEEHFTLSSPNQGVVLGEDDSFKINSRDASTVVIIIEQTN